MLGAQFVLTTINKSLKLEYLVSTANHWNITYSQDLSNKELKEELIKLSVDFLTGIISAPYVKAFIRYVTRYF